MGFGLFGDYDDDDDGGYAAASPVDVDSTVSDHAIAESPDFDDGSSRGGEEAGGCYSSRFLAVVMLCTTFHSSKTFF